MPFNGSGTWSNAGTSFSTPVTGTTISATAAQTFFSDLASNGLSACITKSGQTTVTANIPMSDFKFTGLAAGSANGDSLRYEQGVQAILTTTGDQMQASAANTPARLPAAATVAAHATTMNPWVARIVTLSGSAVTFTDIADAAFVGQQVLLIMNAAHVWTDGAVFDVQGGANYTAAANDQILLTAVTVSTFQVTIFKANGYPVATPVSVAQTFVGSNISLNNTGTYFNVVNTGSIGAAGQVWEITAVMSASDSAGAATILCRIWDGTTVYAESPHTTAAANFEIVTTITATVTLAGAATFYLSAKDLTSTNGSALTTGNSGTANKATSITARRIS